MKKCVVFGVLALLLGSAIEAGNRQDLSPVPDVVVSGAVAYEDMPAFVEQSSVAIPLYTNVRVKDAHEMSPCAQPKIIAVKDPCACEDDCCAPQCVYIQICVPTCGCELISCRRNGDRIRYDYGEYAVDVRVRRNHIEVDYQN